MNAKARRGVLLALALAAAAAPAQAQTEYPNKTIRIVVGFAAGGGNDIFARLVGAKLQELIGQTVIIENKPGAGARLGNEYAANQPADGYTLLVAASGGMSIASAIYPKLGYHPTKNFVPLTMLASLRISEFGAKAEALCGMAAVASEASAIKIQSNRGLSIVQLPFECRRRRSPTEAGDRADFP